MSTAAYRIRRSTRARRVRVSVDPDGTVTVTLPSRAPERLAAEAVQELAPWIARRRKALARAAEDRARPAGTVPYLGEHLTLVPQPGRTRAHRRSDRLERPPHSSRLHTRLCHYCVTSSPDGSAERGPAGMVLTRARVMYGDMLGVWRRDPDDDEGDAPPALRQGAGVPALPLLLPDPLSPPAR